MVGWLFFFLFLLQKVHAQPLWNELLQSSELKLNKTDLVVYDHFLQVYKIASKGYASDYILNKALREANRSPRLAIFQDWLKDLRRFPSVPTGELKSHVTELKKKLKNTRGLERRLLIQRLTYARQIILEKLPQEASDSQGLPAETVAFLKRSMHPLLFGKNAGHFVFFLRKISSRGGAKLIVSELVAEYVIRRKRQVPRDVLSLIHITPDLTRHIQGLGFDSSVTQQVFYTEYSRMIEQAYKAMDEKKREKVLESARVLKYWLPLNLNRLPRDTTLGRYGDLGKNLARNGFSEQAIEVFDFVMAQGNTEHREDALFYRLWMWGSKTQWKKFVDYLEKKDYLAKIENFQDSRLKYWIGYALSQTGKTQRAKIIWENLIERHPISFYAIASTKSLSALFPASEKVKFYQSVSADHRPNIKLKELTPELLESWRRLRAWARLDAKLFLHSEIKGLTHHFIPSNTGKLSADKQASFESDAQQLTAALIGDEDNFLESFRVIYAGLDKKKIKLNRHVLEVLYPKPYYGELKNAVGKLELDPLVLLSLIRQESVFNPEARSRVGARGLMQLMPTTARRLKRSVREKQLSVPKTNLEIGTKYFQQLHQRYAGNLVYVLAAYNAGESRVERWKNLYFTGDDILMNMENIPFLETRNYVKLIFRNLFFYKTLESNAQLTDSADPNQIYDVRLGFRSSSTP